MSKPEYVYRLASAEEWAETRRTGLAPQRDIDRKDGYFHLSTRDQAIATANIHFAGVGDLLALEIPLAAIAADVKFELAPKRGEEFPHLYGALKLEHVARAISLVAGDDGFQFSEAS